MIPIKDKNPSQTVPYLNYLLIGINIVVFAYQFSLGSGVEELYAKYALIPARLVGGLTASHPDLRPLITVFTSMFLHGGFLHILGNMLYMWVFADNIEDKFGHIRFVIFFFLCGALASALHVVIDPHSPVPTVGASGAISGVLAAYLVMFPRTRVVTIIPIFFFLQIAELPAMAVIGLWFVIQFFNGVLSLGYETAGMGGVAWWAHMGGFLAGLVLVFPFRRRAKA